MALTLQNIGEDSFGTYSIKNSMGVSEPVTLLQTVDGSWSLWTSWSSCSKTCLSKLDGFGKNKKIMKIKHFIVLFAATGSQTRTRRCDSPKPQNGGKQCKGEETETTHCINKLKGLHYVNMYLMITLIVFVRDNGRNGPPGPAARSPARREGVLQV